MDRLDELELLVAIIDGGSLAAGARKTRRSSAAVTRALRDLERRVGVRLIERTTRRLAPTRAGRELAEHARVLMTSYGDAMREAAQESATPRGTLRVSAPLAFGQRYVVPVVARFLEAQRQVAVELVLSDQVVDLVEQEVDVAVRIARLPDSGMVAKRIGQVRRVVVASPEYLAAHGTPRVLADLEQHEVIAQLRAGSVVEWRFNAPRRGAVSITPRARLTVTSAEAMIAAACAGFGLIMPLSYQIADHLADRRLVRVLREFAPALVPVSLVLAQSRWMTARTRAFVDFAIAAFATVDKRYWT